MAATETFVDYLRSKFDFIETIVPVYAMSGGTLIALGSDRIVMGNQSQLGPIDAQLPLTNGSVPASSILNQFALAKKEILEDRAVAAAWAPILQSMGPSLLQQAQFALDCGQQMAEFLFKVLYVSSKEECGCTIQVDCTVLKFAGGSSKPCSPH